MKLSPQEIQTSLCDVPGWQLKGNAIEKEFKFDDFKSALDFVNQVGEMAEAADHHPDITICYSRVILLLSTHSAGGITRKDFDLARTIESVHS